MTKHEYLFLNGDGVMEKITEFRGIITGSVHYLTGCNQYLVVPKCDKNNVSVEGSWCDEGRLTLIKENVINCSDVEADENGPDISPQRLL